METLARAKRRARTEWTVFMLVLGIEDDGQRDQMILTGWNKKVRLIDRESHIKCSERKALFNAKPLPLPLDMHMTSSAHVILMLQSDQPRKREGPRIPIPKQAHPIKAEIQRL